MEPRLPGVYNALPHSTSRRLTRAEDIHRERDSYDQVATTEQNAPSPHVGVDSFPASTMESNLNSRNVGGGSTDTGRATSSRPRFGASMDVSRRRKRENKMTELCKAINIAEATREKNTIVRERNAAKSTRSRMPWRFYQEWMSRERHVKACCMNYMNQSGTRRTLL